VYSKQSSTIGEFDWIIDNLFGLSKQVVPGVLRSWGERREQATILVQKSPQDVGNHTIISQRLFVAFELSRGEWRLGFTIEVG
jgi:hypothetical protein